MWDNQIPEQRPTPRQSRQLETRQCLMQWLRALLGMPESASHNEVLASAVGAIAQNIDSKYSDEAVEALEQMGFDCED